MTVRARHGVGQLAAAVHHVAGGLLNPDVYEGRADVDEDEYIDVEGAAEACYHLVEQDPRARTFIDLHTHGRPDVQAL